MNPNPYFQNPWTAFTRLTGVWKAAVIVAVIVALLLASNGVGRTVESLRRARADRRVAKKQQEVEALTRQRDALINTAREREAQAVIVEREAAELRQLINERGGRLAEDERKINDAFAAFKTDAELTAADVPNAERRKRLCAKLRAVGFDCQ